jgi:hypothetical protein
MSDNFKAGQREITVEYTAEGINLCLDGEIVAEGLDTSTAKRRIEILERTQSTCYEVDVDEAEIDFDDDDEDERR